MMGETARGSIAQPNRRSIVFILGLDESTNPPLFSSVISLHPHHISTKMYCPEPPITNSGTEAQSPVAIASDEPSDTYLRSVLRKSHIVLGVELLCVPCGGDQSLRCRGGFEVCLRKPGHVRGFIPIFILSPSPP